MKKCIFPFIALLCIANINSAAPVNVNEALKIAKDFYEQNSTHVIKLTTLAHVEFSSDENIEFYVFNFNDNDGYIIVPADDSQPIMGFSMCGQYNRKHTCTGETETPNTDNQMVTIDKWNGNGWATNRKG
jgi:hypothetical protein